ncbi:MAG: hypothetical protein M1817_001740 [Caeruleum heppii]|nr:MAG: hypothetical protein M1817_001740 [Caeruleum heppii]
MADKHVQKLREIRSSACHNTEPEAEVIYNLHQRVVALETSLKKLRLNGLASWTPTTNRSMLWCVDSVLALVRMVDQHAQNVEQLGQRIGVVERRQDQDTVKLDGCCCRLSLSRSSNKASHPHVEESVSSAHQQKESPFDDDFFQSPPPSAGLLGLARTSLQHEDLIELGPRVPASEDAEDLAAPNLDGIYQFLTHLDGEPDANEVKNVSQPPENGYSHASKLALTREGFNSPDLRLVKKGTEDSRISAGQSSPFHSSGSNLRRGFQSSGLSDFSSASDLQAQPHHLSRVIIAHNIPRGATMSDILGQVRGGLVVTAVLLNTLPITGSSSAMVTFVDADSARRAVNYGQRQMKSPGSALRFDLVAAPTWPMTRTLEHSIVKQQHTRCLRIENFPKHVSLDAFHDGLHLYPELRLNAIEHLSRGIDGALEARFTSVKAAERARCVMWSGSAYRYLKIDFGSDPCALSGDEGE